MKNESKRERLQATAAGLFVLLFMLGANLIINYLTQA